MSKSRILVLILIVAVLATGVYKLVFSERRGEKASDQTLAPVGSGTTFLSERPVISPILAYDDLSIWYFDAGTGELIRQRLDNVSDIKTYPLPEHDPIRFAIWPDTGSDFVIGTSLGRFYYNAQSETFKSFPAQIKFINFLPGGQKLLYVWSEGQNHELSIAKGDLSEHKVIAKLPHGDFKAVSSPNGKSFVLYSNSGPIYFVIDGIGVLEELAGETKVLSGKFSPDGRLFSFTTEENGQKYLYTLDVNSREVKLKGSLHAAGDFTWVNGILYWSGSNKKIMRTGSGEAEAAVTQELVAKELLSGTKDNELFFVDFNDGRLGRLIF